jgi:hypothetical protein
MHVPKEILRVRASKRAEILPELTGVSERVGDPDIYGLEEGIP